MRIKDEIVCFAHLRWCHNGWASNILIVVDTGYAGIHHSKYWMPIHYDTIEDGQNKQSHLLFSNCLLVKRPLPGSVSTHLCHVLYILRQADVPEMVKQATFKYSWCKGFELL